MLEGSSRNATSSESSFDSFDAEKSSISDLTRLEVSNTSVDSAIYGSLEAGSDTVIPRSYQMKKTDSGYKSLEVSSTSRFSSVGWSQSTIDDGSNTSRFIPSMKPVVQGTDCNDMVDDEMMSSSYVDKPQMEQQSGQSHRKHQLFHRTRKMWHSISIEPTFGDIDPVSSLPPHNVIGSVCEEPGESYLQVVGRKRRETESSENEEMEPKRSVILHFPNLHKYSAAQLRALQRDYSIDERSDRLFREFSQTEPLYEMEYSSYTVPRRGRRNRRSHKHTELSEFSPRSHRKKISPQDSIEEESPMDTSVGMSLDKGMEIVSVSSSPIYSSSTVKPATYTATVCTEPPERSSPYPSQI